jgi:hypothetical protein
MDSKKIAERIDALEQALGTPAEKIIFYVDGEKTGEAPSPVGPIRFETLTTLPPEG